MAVEDVVSAKLVLSKLKKAEHLSVHCSQWSWFLFRLPGRGAGEKIPTVLVQLILTTQKRHFCLPSGGDWVLWGTLHSVIWGGSLLTSNPLSFCMPIWKEKAPLSCTVIKLLKTLHCTPIQDSRFFHTVQYKRITSSPTVHSQDDPLIHYFSILTRIMKDIKKSPFLQ